MQTVYQEHRRGKGFMDRLKRCDKKYPDKHFKQNLILKKIQERGKHE